MTVFDEPITVQVFFPDAPFGGVQVTNPDGGTRLIEISTGLKGEQGEQGPQGQTGADSNTTLQNGTTPLIIGQNFIDVVFAVDAPDADWPSLTLNIVNLTDLDPLGLMATTVTNKTSSGFRVIFNGAPDTGNYFLQWGLFGVPPGPPPVATTYLFSGPSSGNTGSPSTNFTVALFPPGATVPTPVIVTPNDGGGGGVFTPATVTISTGTPSATFTYTPASDGMKTLSVTNDGGLTDPAPRMYDATHVPGLILHDSFTDTNGTLLPAHTMDLGPGWTKIEGSTLDTQIESNKAQTQVDALHAYSYVSDAAIADALAEATVVFGLGDAGHICILLFRVVDINNYWQAALIGAGSNNMTISKVVGGTPTDVATGTFVVVAGTPYALAVTLSGNSIQFTIDGGSLLNASDGFNNTATKYGLRLYQNGGAPNTVDEFKVTG